MSKLSLMLLLTTILTAQASLSGRAYVSFNTGVSNISTNGKSDQKGTGDTVTTFPIQFSSQYGSAVAAKIGYKFNQTPFLIELSASKMRNRVDGIVTGEGYRPNSTDSILSPGNFNNPDGDIKSTNIMLNLLMTNAIASKLDFFTGIGVGRSHVKYQVVAVPSDPDSSYKFLGKDTVSTWQLLAGLRQHLTQNLSASLRFGYLVTAKGGYKGSVINNNSSSVDLLNIGRYSNCNILFALEYLV